MLGVHLVQLARFPVTRSAALTTLDLVVISQRLREPSMDHTSHLPHEFTQRLGHIAHPPCRSPSRRLRWPQLLAECHRATPEALDPCVSCFPCRCTELSIGSSSQPIRVLSLILMPGVVVYFEASARQDLRVLASFIGSDDITGPTVTIRVIMTHMMKQPSQPPSIYHRLSNNSLPLTSARRAAVVSRTEPLVLTFICKDCDIWWLLHLCVDVDVPPEQRTFEENPI